MLFTVTNKESEELDPGIKDHNLSISGESAGPSGHKPFVSSPVSKYGESNEIRSKGLPSLSSDLVLYAI